MKFYLNREVVHGSWGGGNLWVKAMYDYIPQMGHDVCNPRDFQARPEIIFLAGLDSDGYAISAEQAIAYKMYVNPHVKIIARINENDARKGTSTVDNNLRILSEHVDATVFVSSWLQDYFVAQGGWKCDKQAVIYNGVDKTHFRPVKKLENGKINIVTHHWSNNRLKGFDIYEKLDEFVASNPEFTFSYIGRELGTFRHTTVHAPTYGQDLGDLLGRYDVYVSGSRFDPGPNHVLEALASGIPTFVHDLGGGAVEFAGQDHVFNDWQSLSTILLKKTFQNNSAITLNDWQTCVSQYVEFAKTI